MHIETDKKYYKNIYRKGFKDWMLAYRDKYSGEPIPGDGLCFNVKTDHTCIFSNADIKNDTIEFWFHDDDGTGSIDSEHWFCRRPITKKEQKLFNRYMKAKRLMDQ